MDFLSSVLVSINTHKYTLRMEQFSTFSLSKIRKPFRLSLLYVFLRKKTNKIQIKGIFKITPDSVAWTNPDAGSENKIAASDLKAAFWTTLHTGCVLQLEMKGGASSRYVHIFVISLSALTDMTHSLSPFSKLKSRTPKVHRIQVQGSHHVQGSFQESLQD